MFKRVLAILIIGMMIAPMAWAARATVTHTAFGYSVTGGTDQTKIADGRIRIRSIGYNAYTAAAVATFCDEAVSGKTWAIKGAAVSNVNTGFIYFGEMGVVFDELAVTLTNAEDVVLIFE